MARKCPETVQEAVPAPRRVRMAQAQDGRFSGISRVRHREGALGEGQTERVPEARLLALEPSDGPGAGIGLLEIQERLERRRFAVHEERPKAEAANGGIEGR